MLISLLSFTFLPPSMALSILSLSSCSLSNIEVLIQIFIMELILKWLMSITFSEVFSTCILLEEVLMYLSIQANWVKRTLLKFYHCTINQWYQLRLLLVWTNYHKHKQLILLALTSRFYQSFTLQ